MIALIFGANGFIASEIVALLLFQGHTVIGTVRNESRSQALREKFATEIAVKRLVLTTADFASLDSVINVIKDHAQIQCVYLTAAVLPWTKLDNNQDRQTTTSNAIVAILNAIKDHAPLVKSVVLTSSVGTALPIDHESAGFTVDSSMWVSLDSEPSSDPIALYVRAKVVADQAAMKFMDQNKSHVQFGLAILLPSLVIGAMQLPPLCQDHVVGSNLYIRDAVLAGRVGSNLWCVVDVRSVAIAHVNAALDPSLCEPGTSVRIIVSNKQNVSPQLCISLMRKHFPFLLKHAKTLDFRPNPAMSIVESARLQYPEYPFEESFLNAYKQMNGLPGARL